MKLKKYFAFFPVFASIVILCITSGCGNANRWDQEAAELLSRSIELEQQHIVLNERIDSLWDTTSMELEKSLPPDFPPVDKDIFLKARNADHIRMFMSYKLLDARAQALVDRAGMYDEVLAREVKQLITQREKYEVQKIAFLQKVGHSDITASREYADNFRDASSGNIQ